MKLVKNAGRIALRAHSMWAGWLGIAVLILPEALYLGLGYDVASPRLWWFLGLALLIYGQIGRLIPQGLSDD